MKRPHILSALLTLLLLLPSHGFPWTSDTTASTPITTALDWQVDPAAVSDGAGGAIVAWDDDNATGSVGAQRVDAGGTLRWSANGVVVSAFPGRYLRGIPDGSGGAIFVWEGDRSGSKGLYAQRLDAAGGIQWAAGGIQWAADGVLVRPGGVGMRPAGALELTTDGAGGAIIVWGNGSVFVQSVDATGVVRWGASGVDVAPTSTPQYRPDIASDDSGGAIITWFQSDGNGAIRAQRVDGTGAVQWGSTGVVVAAPTDGANRAKVISDGAGGAIVAYMMTVAGTSVDWNIYAQRIDAAGAVQWPSGGVALCTSTKTQVRPALVGDGAGGAVVVWLDARVLDLSYDYRVFGQRVDASGVVQWAADGLPIADTTLYGFDGDPIAVVADGAGGAVLSTTIRAPNGNADLHATRVDSTGVLVWGAGGVPVSTNAVGEREPVAVANGSGGTIAVWSDDRMVADDLDVFAQAVTGVGSTSGVAPPNNLTPADGATTDAIPTLTTTPFVDEYGVLTHAASQWRVNDAPAVAPDSPVGSVSADNGQIPFSLPFGFPFYGRAITDIVVTTDGVIELLESGETPAPFLAGLYCHSDGTHLDQMDAIFASTGDLDTSFGYLRVYFTGDHVTVEWSGAVYGTAMAQYPLQFQVELHPDGTIRWNFQQMEFSTPYCDMFSGVYPNGGTEVTVGSAIATPPQASYEFDPTTSTVSSVAYAWDDPGAVVYDSGETATDLTAHTVPAAAGLTDETTYYWGARFKADNGEWTRWSGPTRFTVAVASAPDIAVTDDVGAAEDRQLSFGTVAIGATGTGEVTVANNGTTPLVIGAIGAADPLGGPFSLSADTCSGGPLAVGSTCTLTVQFTPTGTGEFNDTFDIPSDDPDDNPVTLTVSGTGSSAAVPDITVTDSAGGATDHLIPFGEVTAGTTAEQTLTITNDGTAPLTLGTIALANPVATPFTLPADTCSGKVLAGGAGCTLTVRFAPPGPGSYDDTFDIPSDDPDEGSVAVSVSGTGVAAAAPEIRVTDSVTPTADLQVPFGALVVGTSAGATVTVHNDGTAPLTLGAVAQSDPLAAPFALIADACSGTSLAPGDSCTLTLQFAPGVVAPASDTFGIPSDDADEPAVTVQVNGSGVGDQTPPQVILVTPLNGWNNVSVHIDSLTATFSEAMDPAFIDGFSFLLSGAGGVGPVSAADITFDPGARTAWFELSGPLEYDTVYTAAITVRARDLQGNPLASTYQWSFTTLMEGAACDPEVGYEVGCVDFQGFTFGTGAGAQGGSIMGTGPTSLGSARRTVHQGVEYSHDEFVAAGVSLKASARADNNLFEVKVHNDKLGLDGTSDIDDPQANAAVRLDVAGLPPGALLPMRFELTGSFTKVPPRCDQLNLFIYDFQYRPLAGVYMNPCSGLGVPPQYKLWGDLNPFTPEGLEMTRFGGFGGSKRVDFLFPVEPGNGIWVHLLDGGLTAGRFTARLQVDPPPGVTVRLASGLTFTGGTDTDLDGVVDTEDNAPNDATTATPSAATGTGPIAISIDRLAEPGITLAQCRTFTDGGFGVNQTGKPAGRTFPHGLVSFRVVGVAPGGSATVTLDFPTAFPSGSTYYKVDDAGFHEVPGTVAFITGNTVTLILTDDGNNGDKVAGDGIIDDPGGVSVPEESSDGDTWGPCFIDSLLRDGRP